MYTYTYDEEGNLQSRVATDRVDRVVEQATYYPDGSYEVEETHDADAYYRTTLSRYDEHGNCVYRAKYDKEGDVGCYTEYEYELIRKER